jgi:hypothetical protein
MFRSIQNRISRRVDDLKKKTEEQSVLEKAVRDFLVQEFGLTGESLSFSVSRENKKLHLRVGSKTAANEVVLRSGKLGALLRSRGVGVEVIAVD